MNPKIKYGELSVSTWNDFEQLFGERGACGGCWCMYWRLCNKDYEASKGNGNKTKMKRLVKSGERPGIIMYCDNKPMGWCAFAPREEFVRLKTSRILKPVDNQKVWSIVCFFIDKKYRRKGYSMKLLKTVVEICRQKKIKILEAYPIEPKQDKMADAFIWTGIASAYMKAGFKEVERRSETRPIMRYFL